MNQNLDKNFVRNLSSKLIEWTGNRWVITLSKEIGKKTFFESQNIREKEILNNEICNLPDNIHVADIVNIFRKSYELIGKKINRTSYINALTTEHQIISGNIII